jgi:hypothetical protein
MLHVRVCDDGRGGADFGRGSGLVGLRDRVEALGGRIRLYSPPGTGTTLEIALPLQGSGPAGAPDAGRAEQGQGGQQDGEREHGRKVSDESGGDGCRPGGGLDG